MSTYGCYRSLTEDEKRELRELNESVELALATRRKWMDDKMLEISKIKPGDEIISSKPYGGGIVRELYRFHADKHGGIYDTSMSVDYTFEHPVNLGLIDNTSSQIGVSFTVRQ